MKSIEEFFKKNIYAQQIFFVKFHVMLTATIMKINYLVVILLSLGLIYPATTNETCPNPNFKLKHWCQNCLNEEQAIEFTIDRRNFDTGRNSVLAGANLEFLKVGERCENTKFSTVFECDVHRMICKIRGTSCKTFHHYETGHMFYEDTECL